MGADMELVRLFNTELSSIYEGKPPISKAKMAAITRYAVKALKYYKHVVHSVEKFIQKCHNEYKLPALYVLDSIIRQSRHQFGTDKDLFGPRFQKNIKLLFQYIYQCPSEDKPKVVRVLNLWQKNGIYPPETISPLIDMASSSQKSLQAAIGKHKKAKAAAREEEDAAVDFVSGFEVEEHPASASNKKRKGISMSQDDEIKVLKAQLDQQKKQQELLQQQLQMQMMQTKQQSLQYQLQQQEKLRTKMQEQLNPPSEEVQPNAIDQPNLNIMAQIQDLQKQLEKDKMELASLADNKNQGQHHGQHQQPNEPGQPSTIENQSQFLENIQQLIQNSKGLAQSKDPRSSFDNGREDYQDDRERRNSNSRSPNNQHHSSGQPHQLNNNVGGPPLNKKPLLNWEEVQQQSSNNNNSQYNRMDDDDSMQIDNDDYDPTYGQQQPPPAHHQQEDPRKQAKSEEVMTEEMKQIQKDNERKLRDKHLLPAPKQSCITVASVTVWVGRLPRNFNGESLFNHFNEYADVKNIDYIESRGCAFVIMATRFDADSALRYMKHNRIEGHEIRLSWGKTKALFEYSQYWDDKTGCAFIPWGSVTEQELAPLLDTCIVDEDTLPPGMNVPSDKEEVGQNTPSHDEATNQPLTVSNGPPPFMQGFPPPGFLPPPGGMLPPGMQPPPGGFQGGRLPFPPPGMVVPPNMLQMNIHQRPPLQGMPLQQPGAPQGGLGLQRPPLQGLGIPPQQQHQQQHFRPSHMNNFQDQQIRPGQPPQFQGPPPQFPGQQPQRPPQTGFVPAFGGGGPPQSSNFPQRPPMSPGGGRPPHDGAPQGGLNPLKELLAQRPDLQGLISQNRHQQQQQQQQQQGENRFNNFRPQQDSAVGALSQQPPQNAPLNNAGAPQRPPWIQNREPMANESNAHFDQNRAQNANNMQEDLANIPPASFLLNLVNQRKEQAASSAGAGDPNGKPLEEKVSGGISSGGEQRQREDRDSRDRRRSRSRERNARRDRRERSRDRDRSRDRSKRGDRDRSSDRRRDRSGDRRSGRDRDRYERRGGADENRRRTSRDRRDRSRDRDRGNTDRDRRSRDRSQENKDPVPVENSPGKVVDDRDGDSPNKTKDSNVAEDEKVHTELTNQPEGKAPPADLYDPMEADSPAVTATPTATTTETIEEPIKKEGDDTTGSKSELVATSINTEPDQDITTTQTVEDDTREQVEDATTENIEEAKTENVDTAEIEQDTYDDRSPSPEPNESPIFPVMDKENDDEDMTTEPTDEPEKKEPEHEEEANKRIIEKSSNQDIEVENPESSGGQENTAVVKEEASGLPDEMETEEEAKSIDIGEEGDEKVEHTETVDGGSVVES